MRLLRRTPPDERARQAWEAVLGRPVEPRPDPLAESEKREAAGHARASEITELDEHGDIWGIMPGALDPVVFGPYGPRPG